MTNEARRDSETAKNILHKALTNAEIGDSTTLGNLIEWGLQSSNICNFDEDRFENYTEEEEYYADASIDVLIAAIDFALEALKAENIEIGEGRKLGLCRLGGEIIGAALVAREEETSNILAEEIQNLRDDVDENELINIAFLQGIQRGKEEAEAQLAAKDEEIHALTLQRDEWQAIATDYAKIGQNKP